MINIRNKKIFPGGLGVKVFETSLNPKFLSMKLEINVSSTITQFENNLSMLFQTIENLILAIQLFNSTFFEEIFESGFSLLVRAIEVLIYCKPRSNEVKIHIEKFVSDLLISEVV